MTDKRKRDKLRLREIVWNNTQEDAVNMLIEEELCVSKAEAKRVFCQLDSLHKSKEESK